MNYLDVIIAIPLLWALYKGFSKGLIVEICSLLALILGIYGALHFSFYASDLLVTKFQMDGEYLPVISFAITFIAIVFAISLLGKIITSIVKVVALGMLNRIAGALFSFLKVGLILSVIMMWLSPINKNLQIIDPEVRKSSVLWNVISPIASIIIPTFEDKGWGDWVEKVTPKEELSLPISL
ncbi:MAG: membrane protein required for colicin V production [Flavobacteriales bacterium]|jgi:membrane protein required for colicin V production